MTVQFPGNPNLVFSLLFALQTFLPTHAAQQLELWSSNKTVGFTLRVNSAGELIYSIESARQTRIAPSRLGINVDGDDLGSKVRLGTPQTRFKYETFPWRGYKSLATNSCIAVEIPIHSPDAGVDWTLEVRLFEEGVGFRYHVPGTTTRKVHGESTFWNLPDSSTVWFQTDTTNYEGVYQSSLADQIPLEIEVQRKGEAKKMERTFFGPPITLMFDDGTYGLISEAALYNYSGMTLEPLGDAKLRAVFQDDPNGWSHEGPILSPWRVLLLSPDLNALVNNDVIPALCDAPDPELFPQGIQTDWIRPGKAPCTWMVYGNSGAKWHRQKWFVDLAAATGCEYLLVDAGWRTEEWGWLEEGADIWARAAELCTYAARRNVGIVLWHAYPEGRDDGPGLTTMESREEFFRQCQKAGVKGVKIDFFDSESKEMIAAYEDLLRRSAKYQLLINFHGAHKPTGEPRTWPHEITREGIREQEYLLWDVLPLAHYGTLPFTRLVVGHGDFLPGYVQSRFLKNTTVIFQMAASIVMTSPFHCWPDNPEAYLHSPLLQFVRTLPVTWDETRVLPGSIIGESVILARRKGEEWYFAALNCRQESRPIEIDLSGFAPEGKELLFYQDGAAPHLCQITTARVPASGKIHTQLQPGGGFIAHLRSPQKFGGWK